MILDTLTEEAVFSKDCKNPVYITLMNGKSPLADIISKATGDYFTHACISFNSALDPLYSFGSKNDIEKGMGFSITHVKDRAISRNQPYYSVYVMYVSDSAYATMKERLKYFEKNKNKFKYDFKGLVDIFFNRSSENHSTKYFCSRFVMDIIGQAMPLNKVASLWRPQQIESLSNISLVNRGFDLYNYDKKITERNEKLIKQGKYNEDDIIFESDIIQEKVLLNDKDIYYNKDKFDSGEINLCFITGHSGSGKSTMGRDLQSKNIEHYEMDDLQCIKDHFTMSNLKEYGDLIYSFFNGVGKKYYVTLQELKDNNVGSEYEDNLYRDFVHYAMKYTKSHSNRKFVIEGVWLYCTDDNNKPWFKPEEFKDYAFYIKGTSAIISKHRAALRDAKFDNDKKSDVVKDYAKQFLLKNWKWYFIDERLVNNFRKYFSNLEKQNIHENSTILQEIKSHLDKNFKKKSGINFEYIDIHNSKANKYLNNNFHKTNFKDKMKITNGEIVIDKDNDKLAGYVYIGGGDKSNRDYGFIETLEVKKAYRGYGLSNKLLDDAIKKYDAIDLTVYKNNEVAINLYKKHGFVIIGYGNSKDKSDYWMKLKTKLDKGDKIMNESLGLDTQKDYKTKDTLVLNQYTKIKLSDAVVRVYSSRQKSLENIKINNDTKGFIWVDNSNNCVVAVVNTEEKDDGYRWITTFEVFVPYKGKGLSHQLLKVVTNELKATNLEVSEDNDLAIKDYKSLGFSQYKKSGKMIYMSLDKSAGDEPEEDDEDYDDEDFEESTIQELKSFKNPARALKMRHSRKQNIQTKLGNYGGDDNPSSAPDTASPNQDNNQPNPGKKKKSNPTKPPQDSATNESAGRVALNFVTLWPVVYREYVGNKFLTGKVKKQFTNFGFKAGWTYKSFYGFCLGFSNTLKLYDLENPKSMNKSEYSKFIHSMTQDEKFSKRYTVQEKNGGKEIWLVAKTKDTINKKEDLKKVKTESGDMVSSLEKTAEKARALLTKEIFACKDCATAYDNIMTPMEDGYAIIGWNLNKLKAVDLPSFDRCREAVFSYCKTVFEDTNPGYELLEDLAMNCFYIRSKN